MKTEIIFSIKVVVDIPNHQKISDIKDHLEAAVSNMEIAGFADAAVMVEDYTELD